MPTIARHPSPWDCQSGPRAHLARLVGRVSQEGKVLGSPALPDVVLCAGPIDPCRMFATCTADITG